MKLCPACCAEIRSPEWSCAACGWTAEVAAGVALLGTLDHSARSGFAVEFFEQLAQLEAGHFWFRARNRIIAWAVGRYLDGRGAFLEVGCGTGFVLQGLKLAHPDLQCTGSELFPEGLAIAARRVKGADFLQMDAGAIPFVDHFDAVGAFDVLEHIAEDETVLAQFHHSLRPGGWLLLTVPQHTWLWSRNDDHARHQRRYSRAELEEKVERVGFSVVRATSFVCFLLPLLILSRRRRDARKAFDPLAEYRLPRWLQRVLEAVLVVEFAFIRIGVDWPAGGSLLLIARKGGGQA